MDKDKKSKSINVYEQYRHSITRQGSSEEFLKSLSEDDKKMLCDALLDNMEYFDILTLGWFQEARFLEPLKKRAEQSLDLEALAAIKVIFEISKEDALIERFKVFWLENKAILDDWSKLELVNLARPLTCNLINEILLELLLDHSYLVRRSAASALYSRLSKRLSDQVIQNNLLEFQPEKLLAFQKKLRKQLA